MNMQRLTALLQTLHDSRVSAAYRIAPSGRRSRGILAELENRHEGERCFVIGNGPSLNLQDLSRLRREFTFALNRGYLLTPRMGAVPTFLVAVNRLVVDQFAEELAATPCTTFVAWPPHQGLHGSDVVYVRSRAKPGFSTDPVADGIWEGATVTFVALQLAYFMGFREVILIGVDHQFATRGTPHELVRSEGADHNHFDPDYFGPGIRWQLPDLVTSEHAYRLARTAFERAGRRIVNATQGGLLETFERGSYEALTAGEVVAHD